jgi:indole-3-glycerol phosphate synthase
MKSQDVIRADIARKRERLRAYYEREAQILSKDGVKSYGIGIRNLTRFDTALTDVQKAIKQLEDEIAALEGELGGAKPRRALAAVPHGEW